MPLQIYRFWYVMEWAGDAQRAAVTNIVSPHTAPLNLKKNVVRKETIPCKWMACIVIETSSRRLSIVGQKDLTRVTSHSASNKNVHVEKPFSYHLQTIFTVRGMGFYKNWKLWLSLSVQWQMWCQGLSARGCTCVLWATCITVLFFACCRFRRIAGRWLLCLPL